MGQCIIRTNMLRSLLVVAILAVAESVPGRKRPRGGTPTTVRPPVRPTVRTPVGPRCKIVYETVYDTVHERQCTNQYQQSCTITGYREECLTDVGVEDCFEQDFEPDITTNYKLRCINENCQLLPIKTRGKRSPRNALSFRPNNHQSQQNALTILPKTPKDNCNPIPKETCTPVPERSCHCVPVRRPDNMATQVCSG